MHPFGAATFGAHSVHIRYSPFSSLVSYAQSKDRLPRLAQCMDNPTTLHELHRATQHHSWSPVADLAFPRRLAGMSSTMAPAAASELPMSTVGAAKERQVVSM
mmetsp:Transcript_23433/g.60005  ORF Transcript_23433/g.60005 Transcript_23433/m.60005 type:complete len:103 (+) Transcript_23433:47-355(+)